MVRRRYRVVALPLLLDSTDLDPQSECMVPYWPFRKPHFETMWLRFPRELLLQPKEPDTRDPVTSERSD